MADRDSKSKIMTKVGVYRAMFTFPPSNHSPIYNAGRALGFTAKQIAKDIEDAREDELDKLLDKYRMF